MADLSPFILLGISLNLLAVGIVNSKINKLQEGMKNLKTRLANPNNRSE